MPQMSSLFWVLLMITFILTYSLYVITFYFKYYCSLNLFQTKIFKSTKFLLVF